jgi:hypothetical protein
MRKAQVTTGTAVREHVPGSKLPPVFRTTDETASFHRCKPAGRGLCGASATSAPKAPRPTPLRGIAMHGRFSEPAGQRPDSDRWQVQDSNLRSNTATNLQTSTRSLVTCGFLARLTTSARIPHDQRHPVSDSWTQQGGPAERPDVRYSCSAQDARLCWFRT